MAVKLILAHSIQRNVLYLRLLVQCKVVATPKFVNSSLFWTLIKYFSTWPLNAFMNLFSRRVGGFSACNSILISLTTLLYNFGPANAIDLSDLLNLNFGTLKKSFSDRVFANFSCPVWNNSSILAGVTFIRVFLKET